MIISFYLFFTWFTVGILFTWPNRLPKQPHALAFLLCVFLNTNICYLLDDPLHFFAIAEGMSLYVTFSLDQAFIMPAVVALMCNAYFRSSLRKTVVVLISICAFLALDLLARAMHCIRTPASGMYPC